jgi:hypothetical protein
MRFGGKKTYPDGRNGTDRMLLLWRIDVGQKKISPFFRIISGDGGYKVLHLVIGDGDRPVSVAENIEQIVA